MISPSVPSSGSIITLTATIQVSVPSVSIRDSWGDGKLSRVPIIGLSLMLSSPYVKHNQQDRDCKKPENETDHDNREFSFSTQGSASLV
jgi:hypothetical protein